MFLKLMDRAAGEFRVIEIMDCAFHRTPEPVAVCDQGTPGEFKVAINGHAAYLLNHDGKTIEVFSVSQTDRK